ncbi:phosphohistidine phosphatase SixA [candidate division WOR-1 bacterium RIFCSPLOWO2_02_FULL_46_20]|uniref:Phosphohistidine phosphatase SixA n=1 Tax=candidate division WOR-1 bacterium RIFCSPLOWO2_02_FULL_46_20 TaxID=1802567 RepID=A0A1F4R4P3_UNCSA|nr:MAG: phosphohistidine phosphatase SixA [candidate division WOR-1 bacterium RIFCSPHIGHO2_02_FULL_45_12]OGC03124.1 MAG: phosphohistidine phosphatase SixA [candidate division WOR-1 bacterium RIFCSPLOWO2_02_FULL_46_20]
MYLYLIRHGETVTESVGSEQPLSEKGMLDVSEIAAFMSCANIKVDEIWHSTKLRAKTTAKVIAEAIEHKNLVEREGLGPNDPIANIAEETDILHENTIIVGHLPFLDLLASQLLVNNQALRVVNFKTGGVLCLEKWQEGWHIAWMMNPDLLTRCIKPKNR